MENIIKHNFGLLITTSVFFVLTFSTNSCQKLEIERELKIEVDSIFNITQNSVTVKAKIIDIKDNIDNYGHCWGTEQSPTIMNSYSEFGKATKPVEFETYISDLLSETRYFVRPYTTIGNNFSYGKEQSFFTSLSGGKPEIQLVKLDSITAHKVYYQANAISDGGFAIIEKGICIDTSPNPDIENHATINGNDIGKFSGIISDLERASYYFLRAYAVNFQGVSYSNEIKIKTLPELPTIETKEVTDITTNSAVSGGVIYDDGGEELTEKGICWSTEPMPTIENNITANLTESENFISILHSLNAFTKYYIRAYAKNRAGTKYANELSFKALLPHETLIDDRDGQEYNIILIGEQMWMAENLNYYTKEGSSYYNADSIMYSSYGRMYLWEIALNACPTGWHLPSLEDWIELELFLGIPINQIDDYYNRGTNEGDKLKKESDCHGGFECGISNFNATLSGIYNESGFRGIDEEVNYITSTSNFDSVSFVYSRRLHRNSSKIEANYASYNTDANMYSVRCVKD